AYGAPPKKVTACVRTLNQEIEHSPDFFHRLGYQERLTEVRAKIAQHIRADTDEVVLVRNATTGVNTVLRNFAWEKGDSLVTCSSPVLHDPTHLSLTLYPSLCSIPVSATYPTVDQTAQYLSDVSPYPSRKIIALQFPTTVSKILQVFQTFASANPPMPGTKTVVIIDAIASKPGAHLPWKKLVAICNFKSHGFWSVVDAAHSLGQEPDINLRDAQPDFWVS
ncbi:hypothetical protein DXG01_012652, partial [Tephrocybe rancida]